MTGFDSIDFLEGFIKGIVKLSLPKAEELSILSLTYLLVICLVSGTKHPMKTA